MTDSCMRSFTAFVVFCLSFFLHAYQVSSPPSSLSTSFPLLFLHPLFLPGFSSEKCGLPMDISCGSLPSRVTLAIILNTVISYVPA